MHHYTLAHSHEFYAAYSVSSGSAYTAFDKLEGTKNYIAWKNNMHTILQLPCQWGLVMGTVIAPAPLDKDKPTAEGAKALEGTSGRSLLSWRFPSASQTPLSLFLVIHKTPRLPGCYLKSMLVLSSRDFSLS